MEAAVEVVLNDTFNQPPPSPPPAWNPQKSTAEPTKHSAVKYEKKYNSAKMYYIIPQQRRLKSTCFRNLLLYKAVRARRRGLKNEEKLSKTH